MTNFKGNTSRRNFLKKASQTTIVGTLGTSIILNTKKSYAASKDKILIGAPLPLTGMFSGDGEEFRRGIIMAIEDINSTGGVCGHEVEAIIDDAQDSFVEQVRASFERLVRKEKVDAIVCGYLIGSPAADMDLIAESGIPYLNQHAQVKVSEQIEANPSKYRMIFQTCPPGTYYGYGLADFLKSMPNEFIKNGKTVAVLAGDNSYSEQIHKAMRPALRKEGWNETHFEVVPYGIPDWTPTLTKLRNNPPSVIAMCDGIVGDDALFIRQFSELPTESIIYQVFTPSTPEYFDVTGDMSNGVIWSSVIGLLPDKFGHDFRSRYRKRWNGDEPSFAAAGPIYDEMQMWATAARSVGDPKDYEAVNKALNQLVHRCVSCSYHVKETDNTVSSYPTEEKDPSIGLPHAFYQVKNREHRCIWPDPYTELSIAKPSWMS